MFTVVFFFVLTFCIVAGVSSACLLYFHQKQKKQIRRMLRNAEATPEEQRNPDLLRPEDQEDLFARFFQHFAFFDRLELMLDQAASKSTPGKLFAQSFVTGCIGALAGYKFHFALPIAATVTAGFAAALSIPFLLTFHRRNRAIALFEEQFPDALDFLSRSMRAGHAFSVALELLAIDSPEPLRRAFRRVSNETALGSSLQIALAKLVVLVPIVDVQFFVSAVTLQQETGGNLGEILTKLAYIIRERFGLKGKVKAVSAHGRVTGAVLVLMPIIVTGFLLLTNPGYLAGMANVPIGRIMIYSAIGGQFIGYFAIRKIIKIKV